MKSNIWQSRVAAILVASALAACSNPERASSPNERSASAAVTTGSETIYGAAVKLGQGTARSYIQIDQGKVTELGVALSASALLKLPGRDGQHGGHGHEFVLPLPARNPTPYRHITLDWNPMGHEPPGIYDRPHFDFHFYVITQAERMAIDPTDPLFAQKAMNTPLAEYIPTGYVTPPPAAAVPFMGVHWIDPKSPEFNGQVFTRTFIYGTWDGKVIFTEPMITKAFLDSKPNVTIPIPVAERYSPAGVYPSAYNIRWDNTLKQYSVALTGFAYKS